MTWYPVAPAVFFACPSCGQGIRLYTQEPKPSLWRRALSWWWR